MEKKKPEKIDVKKHSIVNMTELDDEGIITDPQGSYTGVPTADPDDRPIQDADDL